MVSSEAIRLPFEALLKVKFSHYPVIVSDATLIAKKIKESDEDADRARMDAEETFDKAERQLSPSLAREGCRKAIHSWDLHKKAIRKAETVIGAK